MNIPDYIQPHGVLLVLQEPHLKIVQVSQNVEHFFGISAEALLGQPLEWLFSRTQVEQIDDCLVQDHLDLCNPFELKPKPESPYPQPFRSVLHRTTDALILELEPLLTTPSTDSPHFYHHHFYHHLQAAVRSLRSTTNLSNLVQTLASEVKAITGFDRVMVYRFEADGHGVVIAEEKESHRSSYLGLRYPATDVPESTRSLLRHNWLRPIPNVNDGSVPLIALHPSPIQHPLDLSNCVLRGVDPCHTEYLQNMGVAASLTISLMDDKHLWGLIACLHHSPRFVDYETRKTCEFLGQFASIELVHHQEQELNEYRAQVKAIQDKFQWTFLQDTNFIEQVVARNTAQLLDLVRAQGAAILLDGHLTLVGQAPSETEIRDLVEWLMQRNLQQLNQEQANQEQANQERVFATASLSQLYPPATQFKDRASGVLAISILLSQVKQKSYHILWFRPEQIQTVNWAGNPQATVMIDAMGEMHLCPRKSFELWKETVREQSYPWQVAELEAAAEMRNTLMLAVLEFSQAALEQSAERAAIANRAKSQFLAKMSHELRTPLNAILGFTQIMNRSPNIPTEFQEHLGIINRSGEHLLTLINDVLEMSKIEAGQLVLTESCFDILRLIRSIQEMFGLKASEKGVRLCIEQDAAIPRYVYGDEAKLRQILINLLSNAIKFTDQGAITLRVCIQDGERSHGSDEERLKRSSDPQSFVLCLEVEDSGCGIATPDLGSIFEAFMQTDRGRHIQGTGLGLSISRQFARLMGGDLTVQSTLNQGSTFTCQAVVHRSKSLDVVEPEANRQVIGLEPEQPAYRILVAEDVLENRQLLVTLLQSIGFEVQVVENGTEAIAQWQAWQPHLIFMDIQMPGMDGYEATRQIRSSEFSVLSSQFKDPTQNLKLKTQNSSTIIIALTAYAFEDDRIASLQAGCDDHIAKPFTETTIFETIARYLGVRYRYTENVAQMPFRSVQKNLTREDLQAMPPEWIAQVHEAALDLNDGKLRQLIAQIPHQEHPLIETLTSLVDNFQLEAIASLTQL